MYDNLKCPFLWNCFLPVLLPTEGFLLNNFDLTEFLQVGCKKCGRVFFFFWGGGGAINYWVIELWHFGLEL